MTLRRPVSRHNTTAVWQPLFSATQLAKEISLCLSGCFSSGDPDRSADSSVTPDARVRELPPEHPTEKEHQ